MNWKRSSIAAVVALPVLALFWFGLSNDPNAVVSPLPGHPAPEFTLERMDLSAAVSSDVLSAQPLAVQLAAHRGEVVVVNFWASWCLPCRQEHGPLIETARLYQDRGVSFFGILYNDSPEAARRWIGEMGGQSYPVLLDPGSRTAIDYGLYGVPETFFIDREGRVAYKHIGPVTRALLVNKLDEILAAPTEPMEPLS